ncbi:MAG: glutathione S-transferase [Phenylobacterium sp.]|nr:glutathione S-transferase [Phenylobacterium sp.]
MIRIYNFTRGARGTRIFWLCEEMGLPYQVEALPYPVPESYRALHPLGSVPFLEDEGGVAMSESVAMLLYLAQRYGPTPLLPTADPARLARVLEMAVFAEATLGGRMNPLMEAHFGAPEADKRNWSVRGLEARVERALDHVADLVAAEGPYLAGPEFTLADIAIGTTFGLWRGALGKPLPDRLAAYDARIKARPAYERAQQATAAATAG